MCCVYLDCVYYACLAKAKHFLLKEYSKVGNLNREANYLPQGAFAGRAEEEIYVVLFAFTGIPVTIYSTIELSDRVIILGQHLKI